MTQVEFGRVTHGYSLLLRGSQNSEGSTNGRIWIGYNTVLTTPQRFQNIEGRTDKGIRKG